MSRSTKEQQRGYNRTYRLRHHEYVLEYNRTYKREHKEQLRLYRKENRDRRRAYKAEYRKANADTIKEYNKRYRIAHHLERRTESAARRAAIRGASLGDANAIKAIYRRARENKNVRCYLCGRLIPKGERQVDHIIPLSRGGAHAAANLAIACSACNRKKCAKMPEEVGLLL
jgi:5-methylcytosine-specific restriction endonuclease McrA